jgi:putative membrane protein
MQREATARGGNIAKRSYCQGGEMRTIGLVLAVLLVVVLAAMLLGGAGMMAPGYGMRGAMRGYGGYGMYGYGAPMGFGYGVVGMILVFASWAVVIGGIAWLITWVARSGASSTGRFADRDTASDILRTRYAKGELTKEQYVEMMKDIGRGE